MRDLFLIGFLLSLFFLGFRRPFIFVCGYVYIDIVSPQRISYYLLSSVPLSLIFFFLCFAGWAMADDKTKAKFTVRQGLMIALLLQCFYTTKTADFPVEALGKWDWVWKALVFAIFLPVTLYTRARFEALLAMILLSLSSIIVVGAAKTMAGGGGYGTLNLMVANNTGLYEGSIISAVAVCVIPLILFMSRHGTIFKPGILTKVYCYSLCLACALIPVGTQARTGLVCLAMLVMLELRAAKRRMLYIAIVAAIAVAAVPMLPKSYTERMNTIQGYKGDASAGTRLAVWKWTLDYVSEHPFGGGFMVYLQNKIEIDLTYTTADGTLVHAKGYDFARAFHNSYFEMLGEQGYPGLILFLLIHLTGIVRMEIIYREYRKDEGEHGWVSPLASALQHAHLIYLMGASFVGIAFQPFIYEIVALEIGFDQYVQRNVRKHVWTPFRVRKHRGYAGPLPAPEAQPVLAAETGAAPRGPERDRPLPRWGKQAEIDRRRNS